MTLEEYRRATELIDDMQDNGFEISFRHDRMVVLVKDIPGKDTYTPVHWPDSIECAHAFVAGYRSRMEHEKHIEREGDDI